MPGEGVFADGETGLVGREEKFVVDEGKEAAIGEGRVCGVACDEIDGVRFEGAIDQAEVHGFDANACLKRIGLVETGPAIGALFELVAEAETPIFLASDGIAERCDVEASGLIAAHDHGKGVGEAETPAPFDLVAGGVSVPDTVEDEDGVLFDRQFEAGREGGAGVFRVEVDGPGQKGLVGDETAAEVELFSNFEIEVAVEVLGENLTEDVLLGEVLCSDVDGVGGGAGGGQGGGGELEDLSTLHGERGGTCFYFSEGQGALVAANDGRGGRQQSLSFLEFKNFAARPVQCERKEERSRQTWNAVRGKKQLR